MAFVVAAAPLLQLRHRRRRRAACGARAARACAPHPASKALIFDCDGVIVESEELHRQSYNECWRQNSLGFEWSAHFYEMLQNTVGGGKEKMRWYFERHGWPAPVASAPERQRQLLVERLHREKTELYQRLIRDGAAPPRPGVLRLMDDAHRRGLKLAVCSAASAASTRLVLRRVLGDHRVARLHVVLAGDDVPRKKPHPMIYRVASERMAVAPSDCVVVEDSRIGLSAALHAGMRVVITHTPYTAAQSFDGAAAVYASLGDPHSHPPADVVTIDALFPELPPAPAAPPSP